MAESFLGTRRNTQTLIKKERKGLKHLHVVQGDLQLGLLVDVLGKQDRGPCGCIACNSKVPRPIQQKRELPIYWDLAGIHQEENAELNVAGIRA